jgi:Ca2+-binding EF-hand superfamily protein
MLGNEDSIDKLRQIFLDCDVDNSGTLSVDELWAACKKMGADVGHEEVIELMSEIDIDKNGFVDVNEFISLI